MIGSIHSHKRARQGNHDGFSLLELLVTLAIIAILATLSTLSSQTVISPDRSIRHEIQQLIRMIAWARDEALLSGETIGLLIRKQKISFYKFDLKKSMWIIPSDKLLKNGFALHDKLFFSLKREGEKMVSYWMQEPSSLAIQPHLFLTPGGEITPFTLNIHMELSNIFYRVHFDQLGRSVIDEGNP